MCVFFWNDVSSPPHQAESWCKENNKPESEILHARLAPDMNDFTFQVRVSCVTARNTTLTADWAWAPSNTQLDDESSLAGMMACVQKDIARLEKLTKADVDGQENRPFRFWTSGTLLLLLLRGSVRSRRQGAGKKKKEKKGKRERKGLDGSG